VYPSLIHNPKRIAIKKPALHVMVGATDVIEKNRF
jgi:hypothetical protein